MQTIFTKWSSLHTFSLEVIREHIQQSPSTTRHKCPSCCLEIFLPQVIGTERFYRELQDDGSLAYYQEEKWDFIVALEDVREGADIIEVGCGPGNFLFRAKPRARTAYGIEFNTAALRQARNRGLQVVGTKDEIAVTPASFDAVFSFHVLEHVADPLEFLKELRSLMKPEGKICLSVPNQDGPLRFQEDAVMNLPPHHATRWHLKTLQVAANLLGLRIIKTIREPLSLKNHYYYSVYWVDSLFTGETGWRKKLKKLFTLLLAWAFHFLACLGIRRLPLLRGQAIYVVMMRQAG